MANGPIQNNILSEPFFYIFVPNKRTNNNQLTNDSSNNEKILVKRLKNGEVQAFNTLYSIYGARLFAFTNGYLKSNFDSEEIVQEAFIIIWRKRSNLNPDLSFKSYLFKIAYHLILETFNKINKREAFKHTLLEENAVTVNNFDERLDYQMLLKKVDTIINQLPPRQRDIFILRKKEGVSIKEIARQLNISPKTTENHISEALKRIKKSLSDENLSSLLFFTVLISK